MGTEPGHCVELARSHRAASIFEGLRRIDFWRLVLEMMKGSGDPRVIPSLRAVSESFAAEAFMVHGRQWIADEIPWTRPRRKYSRPSRTASSKIPEIEISRDMPRSFFVKSIPTPTTMGCVWFSPAFG